MTRVGRLLALVRSIEYPSETVCCNTDDRALCCHFEIFYRLFPTARDLTRSLHFTEVLNIEVQYSEIGDSTFKPGKSFRAKSDIQIQSVRDWLNQVVLDKPFGFLIDLTTVQIVPIKNYVSSVPSSTFLKRLDEPLNLSYDSLRLWIVACIV